MDRQRATRGSALCRTSPPRPVPREKGGLLPSEVVFEEDRVKLLHYIPDGGSGDGNIKHRTPLIFRLGAGQPILHILDILPNKSVVSHFVKRRIRYSTLIDWGRPPTPTATSRWTTTPTAISAPIVKHRLRPQRFRAGEPAGLLHGRQ